MKLFFESIVTGAETIGFNLIGERLWLEKLLSRSSSSFDKSFFEAWKNIKITEFHYSHHLAVPVHHQNSVWLLMKNHKLKPWWEKNVVHR